MSNMPPQIDPDRPQMSMVSYGLLSGLGVLLCYMLGSGLLGGLASDGSVLSTGLDITPRDFMIVLAAGQILFLLVPTIWLANRHRLGFTEVLRLRPPESRFWTYGIALLFCAGILIVTQSVAQEILLPQIAPELYEEARKQTEEIASMLSFGGDIPLLLLGLFTVAVVAPIAEELFFRGLLQRSFEEERTPVFAITLSALIFSFLHLQPTTFFGIAILGLLFGYLAWASGSILPGMLLHALWNGTQLLIENLAPAGVSEVEETLTPDQLFTLLPFTLLALLTIARIVRRIARGE